MDFSWQFPELNAAERLKYVCDISIRSAAFESSDERLGQEGTINRQGEEGGSATQCCTDRDARELPGELCIILQTCIDQWYRRKGQPAWLHLIR